MRRAVLSIAILSFALLATGLMTSTACAQSVGMPSGGFSAAPVTPEVAAPGTSTTDSFFSQYFRSFNFRGWGTSVVARPAYRSPALVLRERVGKSKTR